MAASNLEIDINKTIGKLHLAALANAKKATRGLLGWKDAVFGDISKMLVNTGIRDADKDEPVFCGPGKTYEILLKRKGALNTDRCVQFVQEYMKWFAGDAKFNLKKWAFGSVQSKKTNSRYFKFEYKVVVKKIAEKKKPFRRGKEVKESEGFEIQVKETGNGSETQLNNNIWMNKCPFGVK